MRTDPDNKNLISFCLAGIVTRCYYLYQLSNTIDQRQPQAGRSSRRRSMRRVVLAAVFVSALVGVVGADSIIKAKNAGLPYGSITTEEIETVMVEASALGLDSAVVATNAGKTQRGTAYAMYYSLTRDPPADPDSLPLLHRYLSRHLSLDTSRNRRAKLAIELR